MRRVLVWAICALALCAAPGSASPDAAAELVAKAQDDLAGADGIAAEAHLQQAIEKGASREAVAAYMGEALIAQGQPDRARIWLAPGRFSRETTAYGFRVLAHLEQMQGDLPAAGAAFDRVMALTPKDAGMWVEIARLRYAGGEHMLALDAANYAFDLDPTDVRVLELRGQIIRDQYGLVTALPWFESALGRAPDDPSVLGEYAATLGDLGRTREMLAVTRKLMKVDPGNPRGFYLQAVLAARAGDFELARRLLGRAGDKLDAMPAARLLEGVLEIEAGNYVLASEALEALVRSQPANVKARTLLMRALYLSGEYRQLVTRFADAAEEPHASSYILTLLARAYEALGDRQSAAPLLDRAATARANGPTGPPVALETISDEAAADDRAGNFDAQLRAGDAQLALGNGDGALARYVLAARIRLPELLMLRMVAAHRMAGQDAPADALIESFLAQNPRSENARRLAARLAAARGDWPRARLLLGTLRADGGQRDVGVLAALSLAELRDGDAKAAAATAQAAWQLQPASPLAVRVWALSLAASGGEPTTARALVTKARALSGDDPLTAEAMRLLGG